MATKKTAAASTETTKTKTPTWKQMISALPLEHDSNGEQIRHDWSYATENVSVLAKHIIANPSWKFSDGKGKDGYESLWDETDKGVEYTKWRGTPEEGWLKDSGGKVRTDVPVRKRYIIGRGEKKRQLIENLAEIFDMMGRKDLVDHVKSQKPTAAKAAAAKKPLITLQDGGEANIHTTTGCANIPLKGLLAAVEGTSNPEFKDGAYVAKIQLKKDGNGFYYRVELV